MTGGTLGAVESIHLFGIPLHEGIVITGGTLVAVESIYFIPAPPPLDDWFQQ